MDGALDAIYKICEDVPEELDVDVPGLPDRKVAPLKKLEETYNSFLSQLISGKQKLVSTNQNRTGFPGGRERDNSLWAPYVLFNVMRSPRRRGLEEARRLPSAREEEDDAPFCRVGVGRGEFVMMPCFAVLWDLS